MREQKRFNVLAAGRRWGKTFLVLFLIVAYYSEQMAAVLNGQTAPFKVCYISLSYKNLKPVFDVLLHRFQPIEPVPNREFYTITLPGNFIIEFWTLDKADLIRGREFGLLIVDEAAFIPDLESLFFYILMPTLAIPRGKAWFMSSPNGYNDFHKFFELGQNPMLQDLWQSWQLPCYLNPMFTKEEQEVIRRNVTDEVWEQEYLAEFRSSEGAMVAISDFEIVSPETVAKIKEESVGAVGYWDIADSVDGDYTAFSRLDIARDGRFLLSDFFRKKGKFTSNLQLYYAPQLLKNGHIPQFIETKGLGNFAYEVAMHLPILANVRLFPTTKEFHIESKETRARGLWVLEAKYKRILISDEPETKAFLQELTTFPKSKNDDWVDTVSGNFLAVVVALGGAKHLLQNRGQVFTRQDKEKQAALSLAKAKHNALLEDISEILESRLDSW